MSIAARIAARRSTGRPIASCRRTGRISSARPTARASASPTAIASPARATASGSAPSPSGSRTGSCGWPSRPSSLLAVGEVLLGDREGVFAGRSHRDVLHQAAAAGDVGQLDVVAAGIDALQRQLLVGIDRLVLDVVEALVRAPVGRSGGREIGLVDRIAGGIPELQVVGGTGRR